MQKKNSYLKEYIQGGRGTNFVFFILFLSLGCVTSGTKTLTPVDFMFLMVKGFSYQKFQVTELLYYLFYFIFPLFWINVFLENEKKDRNVAAKFRYGSRAKWDSVTDRECFCFLLRYYVQFILCVLVVDAVLVMVFHDSTSVYFYAIQQEYGIHTEEVYLGFVVAFLWRFVELLLLLEVDLCLYRLAGNTLAAFFGTFVVYLLGVILRRGNIIIAGLSAAYSVFELIGLKNGRILMGNLLAGMSLVLLGFVLHQGALGKIPDILAKK